MAREPHDEPAYVMVDDQLVTCLGPRCIPRRADITPKPARPVRPPKTRREVMPQPVAKPVKEKKPTKVRQQRAAARPIPVVAVATVLVAIFVAANLDTIELALIAAAAAVLHALAVAALTAVALAVALAAGYANGRWVVPAAIRLVGERRQAYRGRAVLREVLTAPIPMGAPAIALEPVPEQDVQEWINRGLRNRRIDGFVAETVERKR